MAMHTWFIFALLSALFAGLHTYTQKIAVEKGYSSPIINVMNFSTSASLALITSFLFGLDNEQAVIYGVLLAATGGAVHMLGSIVRMDGLRYVDTAIFFPLYKTIGPIFTVILGILFFNEWFTAGETIGITLGIIVPLLLVHKSEKARQLDLRKGILFVLISAFFTAVSASIAKLGSETVHNIFIFVAVTHIFGALSGIFFNKFYKKNKNKTLASSLSKRMLVIGLLGGVLQFATFVTFLLALKEGDLAVVYTINSFYILIPIVLSIIFYKEHFNARKALAIGLSILAIFFLN